MMNDIDTENTDGKIESRISKHIEKPLSKKERKKINISKKYYEKQHEKKIFDVKEKKSLKFKIVVGIILTIIIIFTFRYLLKVDLTLFFKKLEIPTLFFTGSLIALSLFIVITDKSEARAVSNPITDYFILTKIRISGKIKRNLKHRINTRFIMVTLLKLYQKDQLAIVNEKFIFGILDDNMSKDEIVLIDFLVENEIEILDDFLEILELEKNSEDFNVLNKIEIFYEQYKNAVIEMAYDKKYINLSINKAKLILRSGGILFSLIVLALLSKGQGTLITLGLYIIQAIILFLIANFINARSKGAHLRISQLRKEKKILLSVKNDIYTALIYNYLFEKEDRILKNINKLIKNGNISESEYEKFSESYNSFNYLLENIKLN